MPWMKVKEEGKFVVYKQGDDKKPVGNALGTHDTEDEANKQLAALYASEKKSSADFIQVGIVTEPNSTITTTETTGTTGSYIYVASGADDGGAPAEQKPAESIEEKSVALDFGVFTLEELTDAAKRQFQSNVGGGVDRDKLPASSFVFGDDRAFPIVNSGDVKDAVSSWGRYKGKHSFDEFKSRLTSIAKRKGFESSLPNEWKEKKSVLRLDYVKSVSPLIVTPDMAVKYVARDEIKGYTFLWGNDNITDVEYEYFTKQSNFWDDRLGKSPRPLTWDHAQDIDFKAHPTIGEINEWGDDDIGRWYTARLDRNHAYRKAIDKLIEEGALGTSSDSAPQYVQRVKTGKATWLKEWPWFASALTDVPAEPRMIGSVEVLKSLGVQFPPDVPKSEREAMELKARYYKLFIKP